MNFGCLLTLFLLAFGTCEIYSPTTYQFTPGKTFNQALTVQSLDDISVVLVFTKANETSAEVLAFNATNSSSLAPIASAFIAGNFQYNFLSAIFAQSWNGTTAFFVYPTSESLAGAAFVSYDSDGIVIQTVSGITSLFPDDASLVVYSTNQGLLALAYGAYVSSFYEISSDTSTATKTKIKSLASSYVSSLSVNGTTLIAAQSMHPSQFQFTYALAVLDLNSYEVLHNKSTNGGTDVIYQFGSYALVSAEQSNSLELEVVSLPDFDVQGSIGVGPSYMFFEGVSQLEANGIFFTATTTPTAQNATLFQYSYPTENVVPVAIDKVAKAGQVLAIDCNESFLFVLGFVTKGSTRSYSLSRYPYDMKPTV